MMAVSRPKNKKSRNYIRLLAFTLGGMLIVAVALIIATPRNTTAPTVQTQSEDDTSPTETKTQTDDRDHSNTTTAPPRSSPTTPQPPATLPNCQYEGGPPDGRHCPVTPPASYSATVNCYGTSAEPISCPDWSTYMRRISVDKVDGVSYCLFTFWGGGTSETYHRSKRVKVTNNANPNGYADCSIEQPLE